MTYNTLTISGYNSAPSPAPYSPVSVFTRGRDSRYSNTSYNSKYTNNNYNSVPSASPGRKVKSFVHSQHSSPLHRFNLNYGK